jgi:hypothetical protein
MIIIQNLGFFPYLCPPKCLSMHLIPGWQLWSRFFRIFALKWGWGQA